jgi:hypothetical protein
MGCSDEPGHPRYRNNDPEDQVFTEGELLYRRYKVEHFQNQQLLPSAFKFPRQSFNREKYSQPEDVLHRDCCNGKKLHDGWGVLECSSSNLPTPVVGQDGKTFQFEPVHEPLECCYAHTEIWCKATGGEQVDEPSPKVRETFRVRLAQKMTVRIQAST